MGLKLSCLSPFHLFPDLHDPGEVHRVLDQSLLLDQLGDMLPVHCRVHDLVNLAFTSGWSPYLIALKRKISKWHVIEGKFAQDLEDLTTEGLPFLF